VTGPDVKADENPRRPAAFFDMDRTLLSVNSGVLWLEHLIRRRAVTPRQVVKVLLWLLGYRFALIDGAVVSSEAAATVAGRSEEELREECARWFADKVAHHVSPLARAAVEEHRAKGHLLAVLSSSPPYVSEPLARRLDIPNVVCTRLEVRDGRFTGKVLEPACYGAGKMVRAREFAGEHGLSLDGSWFYTDSYSDLPMLLGVGHPVAVNPDLRLARHARRAGWPIHNWRS
jgi:HAD superfamily hydrolase (TIGR01490 family)